MFMFSFAISSGGLLAPYLVEFLPPIALNISYVFQWLTSLILLKFSLDLIAYFGVEIVFGTCAVLTLIQGIFVAGYAIETKNKTQSEIHYAFIERTFFK